jgi:hypothetical protein
MLKVGSPTLTLFETSNKWAGQTEGDFSFFRPARTGFASRQISQNLSAIENPKGFTMQ